MTRLSAARLYHTAPALSSAEYLTHSLSLLIIVVVSGEQMGYGFVLFSNPDDAHRAIVALHGCALGTKTMHVSVAKQRSNPKRSSQPNTPSYTASTSHPTAIATHLSLAGGSPSLLPHVPNTNVYLAGVPHAWVKADLDDLASPFGHIMESRVLVDKQTQENRGIGFVRFERVEEAAAAILALNGTVPPGGNEVMTVKLAVERGDGRRDSLRKRQPCHDRSAVAQDSAFDERH